MTDQEFKQLEQLLDKLRGHLKADFYIRPNWVQDGFHIVTYDAKGKGDKDGGGMTIKDAIERLKPIQP